MAVRVGHDRATIGVSLAEFLTSAMPDISGIDYTLEMRDPEDHHKKDTNGENAQISTGVEKRSEHGALAPPGSSRIHIEVGQQVRRFQSPRHNSRTESNENANV